LTSFGTLVKKDDNSPGMAKPLLLPLQVDTPVPQPLLLPLQEDTPVPHPLLNPQ